MSPEEKQQHYQLAETLYSEQNFGVAVIAGVVAMVLAAGIYAVITVASGGTTYAVLAVGVGAVVGFSMQFLGRGIDTKFSVVASILAVFGCVLGNLFAGILMVARVNGISPFSLLQSIPPQEWAAIAFSSLQFADLIFWIVAAGAASYLAKRRLSRKEGLAIHVYEARPKSDGPIGPVG